MAGSEARTTLPEAHDTDAPFAERARRPAGLSRRRPRGLGTHGRRRASPDGLACQRHGHLSLRGRGAATTATKGSTSACCARCGCARSRRASFARRLHRRLRGLREDRRAHGSARPVHGALRAPLERRGSSAASTSARASGSAWPAAPAAAPARTSTSRSGARASPSIRCVSSARLRARGRLAQLGEHQLDKLGVTGSSPVPPIGKAPETGPFLLPIRRARGGAEDQEPRRV